LQLTIQEESGSEPAWFKDLSRKYFGDEKKNKPKTEEEVRANLRSDVRLPTLFFSISDADQSAYRRTPDCFCVSYSAT
jgi:hypothetical protein